MEKLEKLEKQSPLKSVIEGLRRYIINNELKVGDRLPTENELSESLGISRNIIREGMRYYRTLGIVASHPKTGAEIASLWPKNPFGGYLPFLEQDPKSISEAAEIRMALECGSAPLMVAGITEEDIAKLEEMVENLSGKDFLEAEIHFHSIMLRATRNRLIESMIPLTVEFFSRKKIHSDKRNRHDVVTEHRNIIEALRKRNVKQLSAALITHYMGYFK